MEDLADRAARRVYSLEEPWRERFIAFVSRVVGADGRTDVTEEEFAAWLRCWPYLDRFVDAMLRSWRRWDDEEDVAVYRSSDVAGARARCPRR